MGVGSWKIGLKYLSAYLKTSKCSCNGTDKGSMIILREKLLQSVVSTKDLYF